MLELTKGGRCMGGLDALRFFETLPDMIPDEVKTETFCDEYEYALNRVRVWLSWEIPAAPGKGKGHQVLYCCGQCGHGVRAEHKYCPKCGRAIDWWSLYGQKAVPYDSPLQRLMELAPAEKDERLVVLSPEKAQWVKAVMAERERQDKKWGYPQENTYCEWASILAEETGELCQELNELNFGRGSQEQMEREAVQVAAVALSILEQSAVSRVVTIQAAAALGRLTSQKAEEALRKENDNVDTE